MTRRALTTLDKLKIMVKQAVCPDCSERLGTLDNCEFDHLHQLAMGGSDTLDNLRAKHVDCHARKTAKDAASRAKVRRITGQTKGRSKADRFAPLPTGADVFEPEGDSDTKRAPKKPWPKQKMQSRGFKRRTQHDR
jgi:hypothetical protein